jgi:hypothetical protein
VIAIYTVFADPSGRAVLGVGLRPLGWWGRWLEPRWGHGCSSCVYMLVVLSCVGRGLYGGLIIRREGPNLLSNYV